MEKDIKYDLICARNIPTLGKGGRSIRSYLVKYSSDLKPENDIVEVGSWFGSVTAFLAIGLKKSENKKSKIHCYDKWEMTPDYARKMKSHYGTNYKIGDVKKYFMQYTEQFRKYLTINKGDITKEKKYKGKPIALLVLDFFGKSVTESVIKLFAPHMIQDAKIIMMDYYYFNVEGKISKDSDILYQKKFVELNKSIFEPICKTKKGFGIVLKYNCGDINYEVEG